MQKQLLRFLYASITITIILGFVFPNKHAHFWWQKIPFYDAVFGFIGCIIIIIFAKWLGNKWLLRDEDYYD